MPLANTIMRKNFARVASSNSNIPMDSKIFSEAMANLEAELLKKAMQNIYNSLFKIELGNLKIFAQVASMLSTSGCIKLRPNQMEQYSNTKHILLVKVLAKPMELNMTRLLAWLLSLNQFGVSTVSSHTWIWSLSNSTSIRQALYGKLEKMIFHIATLKLCG